MKKAVLKKFAVSMTTLLIASVLAPVMAFAAAWFTNVTFHANGTITGEVYSDTDISVAGSTYTYIQVLDANGNVISVGKAVYTKFDGTHYYYTLQDVSVPSSVYQSVYLRWAVTDSVYGDLFGPVNRQPYGSGIFLPVTTVNGTEITLIGTEVSASDLARAFANGSDVTIKITGDYVNLPASALLEAAKNNGKSVTISNDNGTYTLPLSVLDFEALADELGADLANVKIKIQIKKVTGDTASAVANAVANVGGTALADAVDFSVTAEANGKSVEINDFGDTYVQRTLKLKETSSNATAVVYDPENGQLSFVPATFNGNVATIKRNSNSIYTVISVSKSFNDVVGHWGRENIELLANKLVVEGVGNGNFSPDRNITRAEFAALIVRSLGLKAGGTANFSDVKSTDWFAAEVAAAANAGIVNGYPDGTFRPNAKITREELAAMVVRAAQFAGLDTDEVNAGAVLAKYNDAGQISWAHEELAIAVDAGIVQGKSATRLAPKDNAERAEAATMIARFLKKVGFIN